MKIILWFKRCWWKWSCAYYLLQPHGSCNATYKLWLEESYCHQELPYSQRADVPESEPYSSLVALAPMNSCYHRDFWLTHQDSVSLFKTESTYSRWRTSVPWQTPRKMSSLTKTMLQKQFLACCSAFVLRSCCKCCYAMAVHMHCWPIISVVQRDIKTVDEWSPWDLWFLPISQ